MKRLHLTAMAATCLALSLAVNSAIAQVVAVVSSASPVTSLSKSEVADIFLGRVRSFPDGKVAVPIDLPEGSPVRNEFYATMADKTAAQIKAHWSKIIFTGRGRPPTTVADAAELKRRIAADPAAIGYLDRSQLDARVRVLR